MADDTLLERIVLTPAERAVLVEQAEAARVALAKFVTLAKDGTSAGVIRQYQVVADSHEYIVGLIQTKVQQRMTQDHQEGREH